MTKQKFLMIKIKASRRNRMSHLVASASGGNIPSSKVSYFNRRSVIIILLKTKESKSQPVVLRPFFTPFGGLFDTSLEVCLKPPTPLLGWTLDGVYRRQQSNEFAPEKS